MDIAFIAEPLSSPFVQWFENFDTMDLREPRTKSNSDSIADVCSGLYEDFVKVRIKCVFF